MNRPPRFAQLLTPKAQGRRLPLAAPLGALALAVLASLAQSAQSPKPSTAATAASSELVVTQSVFVLPTSPQEGRDPFFPRSTRPYAAFIIARTNNAAVVAPDFVDLHLNGISGTAARPLAIINNRTFEIGEQAEVFSSTGHSKIRCIEIRADSVIVQIGGERRMLHLRSGI